MRSHLWRVYLGVGLALAAAYFALPGADAKDGLYIAMAVAAAVAVLGSALRRPRGMRRPGLLLGAGMSLWAAGEVVWALNELVWGHGPGFPSLADALYLSSYPMFAAGLLSLERGRSHDRAALVDAVIVALAAAALGWAFFAEPYLMSSGPWLAKAVAIATPLADVLILGGLTWALLVPSLRTPAIRLLLVGLVATLVADVAYSTEVLYASYRTGDVIDLGWLVFFVCWGAAGLHPSMGPVEVPSDTAEPRFGRRRLLALLAAALVPNIALAVDAIAASGHAAPVLTLTAIVMVALVGARMAYLSRQTERDAAAIAEQHAELATALARLQLMERQRAELTRKIVRAAEEERARVAADLHDGPVQKLTALTIRANLLEATIASGDHQTATERLAMIREQLSGQIAELRRIIADLRPPELDEGLDAAIRALADALGRRARVGVAIDTDLRVPIEPDVETILFRVTQEALSNIERHARAANVRLRVRADPDGVSLEIADDGRGFDPGTGANLIGDGHFGLAGMRERVEAADGIFEVASAPGVGTRIRARMPTGAVADRGDGGAAAGVVA